MSDARPPLPGTDGTAVRMSHKHASTSGTFIAKMTRQESTSTSSPPSGGPTAIAALVPAVQEPIAAARSPGPKTAVMIASELGTSSAPNAPCSARAAIKTAIDGATAHSSEAVPKPATPIAKIRRRP